MRYCGLKAILNTLKVVSFILWAIVLYIAFKTYEDYNKNEIRENVEQTLKEDIPVELEQKVEQAIQRGVQQALEEIQK